MGPSFVDAGAVESLLKVSIDHLHDGVQVIGHDWTYLYLNEPAARHGQRQAADLLGRTMMDCYPGILETAMFERLDAVMRSRQPDRFRNQFTFPDGSSRWFDLAIEPVPDGICVISLDVTDQQRIQEELHQSQKMEAVGRLAGGLAHDFNNQLTVIIGFSELVLGRLPHDSGLAADVREIRNAARLSSELTREILRFGRQQALTLDVVDLNDVVRDLERLLGHLLGEDVRFECRLDSALPPIVADAAQLTNILTNLAANARDAMPRGGRLTISTFAADETVAEAEARPDGPSRFAVLRVVDTGYGMDAATRARIFEPFFTTKPPGHGTGLGLSTVYGLTRRMGGLVRVRSEPGQGTTFDLVFPASDARPVERPTPAVRVEAGKASILVVEDEAAVLEYVVRVLNANGYHAFGARSIAEGLAVARRRGDAGVDLLVADIVLPDGAAEDVLAGMPEPCRLLLMSGHSSRRLEQRGVPAGVPLLEKPFTIEALLDAVGRALG